MPLIKSSSDEARSKNIREMIKSGHPRDQAAAASYSNQRRELARHRHKPAKRHRKTAHRKTHRRVHHRKRR